MLNEGLVFTDTTTMVKSEMVRALHRLGTTTPDDLEQEVFRAITGHSRDDIDWSVQDNHAGYYSWLRSFDQLISELLDDGYAREEDVGGGERQLVPVERDPGIEWSQFVYPSRRP